MFFSGLTWVYPSCSIGLISDSRNHMSLVYGDHLVCRDASSVEISWYLFLCVDLRGFLRKMTLKIICFHFARGKHQSNEVVNNFFFLRACHTLLWKIIKTTAVGCLVFNTFINCKKMNNCFFLWLWQSITFTTTGNENSDFSSKCSSNTLINNS